MGFTYHTWLPHISIHHATSDGQWRRENVPLWRIRRFRLYTLPPRFCVQAFGDVWELRMDVSYIGTLQYRIFWGEIRTVKAGLYRYITGSVLRAATPGLGGKFIAVHISSNYAFDLRILAFCLCCCRGRVFFCGKRRLKDGWKEQNLEDDAWMQST